MTDFERRIRERIDAEISPAQGRSGLAGCLLAGDGAGRLGSVPRARLALANLSTIEARADWETWQREAALQSKSGPVRRAQSESPEPPMLVLLRDHFGVMLAAAAVFSSLLFATAMIAAARSLWSGTNAAANPRSAAMEPLSRSAATIAPGKRRRAADSAVLPIRSGVAGTTTRRCGLAAARPIPDTWDGRQPATPRCRES